MNDCRRGCCWSPYGHATGRDRLPRWHRDACHCHDTEDHPEGNEQ